VLAFEMNLASGTALQREFPSFCAYSDQMGLAPPQNIQDEARNWQYHAFGSNGKCLMLFRLLVISLIMPVFTEVCVAEESRDIKAFVQDAFHKNIEEVKKGIYCAALSCDFEIESFFATEIAPQTYQMSASGWLEGTIPGLKGSAKRKVGLTGSYTRGTCIFKDVKTIFDITTNNNGWGASRIEGVFKRIEIPKAVVLTKEDCKKVDDFIVSASSPGVQDAEPSHL
jgi:hypothetical protein